MSSTFKLQDTVNACEPYLQGKPLAAAPTNEPALTNANLIKQTLLAPPFSWRWNRAVSGNFATVVGATDNTVALSDFGYIERAYLVLANSPTYEIPNIAPVIGPSVEQGRPHTICPYLDDNAGNITLRVAPAYDKVYQASIVYQRKASLMTCLASTWTPIPDEMAFIVNYGYLALALLYHDDPRFQIINNKFVSHLLAASEGLTETMKNLFLEKWTLLTAQADAQVLRTKHGAAARTV